MWEYFNNNPLGKRVGDCSVRAVSVALGVDWNTAYLMTTVKAYQNKDMPSSNDVIIKVLSDYGFKKIDHPEQCTYCYTVKEYCEMNKKGIFVLFLDGHVVTAIDGNYFDSWDSGEQLIMCIWGK